MENYLFKILMGGCVGHKRTEIINRFTTGKFRSDTKNIIGIDFAVHNLYLPEKEETVTLQIWDFGQEKQFRSLIPMFCQGASGVMLYFDLPKPETLQELEEWILIIRKHTKKIPIILCGINNQEISVQTVHQKNFNNKNIQDFIHKHNLNAYFGVNVDTGRNINESFERLSMLMVQQLSSLCSNQADRTAPLVSFKYCKH